MAHLFDRTDHDPYVEAAHQVEQHAFSGPDSYVAGAEEGAYNALSDAIVTAIGDIGAAAFRLGVNSEAQLKGLAQAIAASAPAVLRAYRGEVDPTPLMEAMRNDPRAADLPPVSRDKLIREIEKTAQLEALLLNSLRIPALIDYADSLGLRDHEDALDNAEMIVPGEELPSPDTGGA